MTLLAGVLAAASIAGCSASGAKFAPLSAIPDGRGVVYVYRQPSFVGSAVYGTVEANGVPVTKIRNGGYFPFVGPAGPTTFTVTTEATNTTDVTVEAGQAKFLKTTIGMGLLVGHLKLTEVSTQIGEKEIAECKLLEAAQQ